MRIVVDINGYYDWEPAPPGTKITQADVDAQRVKQMHDEKWHLKVHLKCDAQTPQHHDVGIHEEALCQRMAALEVAGKPQGRLQTVIDSLNASFTHHLHPSHIVKIKVHDDGPDEAVYRAELAKVGLDDVDHLVEQYLQEDDLEASLNAYFVKPSKPRRKR